MNQEVRGFIGRFKGVAEREGLSDRFIRSPYFPRKAAITAGYGILGRLHRGLLSRAQSTDIEWQQLSERAICRRLLRAPWLKALADLPCPSLADSRRGLGNLGLAVDEQAAAQGSRHRPRSSRRPRSHVQILAEDASCGNHCGKYPLVGSTKARGNKHQRNSPAATTNILYL
jgi:hypothetical protein